MSANGSLRHSGRVTVDAEGKTSPAVASATVTLNALAATDMPALTEASLLACDPGYVLSPRAATVLGRLGLLDADGQLLDTAREAVLAWQPRKEAGDG